MATTASGSASADWPPRDHDDDAAPRVAAHVQQGVGYIVMNRPTRRNALDGAMRAAIMDRLDAWRDDPAVRVVVLAGTGRTFAAGADLRELLDRSADEQRAFIEPPNVYGALQDWPGPVIACINGHALGAGCELLMACDVRIAAASAKVGQPETNLGLIPGGGGTQRLPRLVGYGRAMHLVLSGEPLPAETAAAWGLVDLVRPDEALHNHVRTYAEALAQKSPVALRNAKRALQAAWERPLSQGLAAEIDLFVDTFASPEAREGITAFLERRKPSFGGSP